MFLVVLMPAISSSFLMSIVPETPFNLLDIDFTAQYGPAPVPQIFLKR